MLRVSEVLAIAGLTDPSFFTDRGSERGTAAHATCALDDIGDLDETSVDPIVAPYLAAWRKFRSEMKPEILAVEEPVESVAMGFCTGGIDRRVMLDGRETILDIKTGSPLPEHAIQLAAYCLLFPRIMARGCVYLRDDGSYQIRMFHDRKDFAVFKAALTVAAWKKENRP